MLSAPVQAEDGVEAQGDVTAQYGKLTRKKEKRVAPAAKETAPAGGGFSLPLPSFSAPEAPKAVQLSSEAAPVVPFKVSKSGKAYINPSDERDLDELPLTRTNIPLLTTFLFGPSFVYLAFWVFGSLNII